MSEESLKERIRELEQRLRDAEAELKSVSGLLDKKLDELYTFYHISRTISSVLDIKEMLRQMTGIIKKTVPFDRLSLYLMDQNNEMLELAYFSGLDIKGRITLAPGEGTPGRIITTGEHVQIHDLAVFYETFDDFIHYPGEARRDGSYIGIALKTRNRTIGVIGMDSIKKHGLGVDDMDIMAVLSYQIASGVEQSRLFDKIQALSQKDGLTGLYNHRVFQERLQQEISRRNRTGKPLSLLMLDIDHFKQLNDAYGHQAGDAVLRQLATIISGQCRCNSIDICCRYGGEELAIIMPEIDVRAACSVAERLRKVVESHPFDLDKNGRKVKITISLGVAGISGSEELGPEELIKKADEALYLSKKCGRNCVNFSPTES